MSRLTLKFFLLILRVIFNFALNIIHKSNKIHPNYFEEKLLIFSNLGYNFLIFHSIFILLPAKEDLYLKN